MSHQKNLVHRNNHQLFGVELHDFIAKEAALNDVELASEFGISIGSVRKLKKQIR